jgi:hypothetical protein
MAIRRFISGASRRPKAGVLDAIVVLPTHVATGYKTWSPNGQDGSLDVGGTGYTYGDSDAAKVLTTAAGAGTYVVPVVGQVLAPAQGGTAYGPASGTSGTLTLANTQYVLSTAPAYGIAGTGGAKTATTPTASNVLTGTGAYGVNGTGSTPSYSPDFPSVGNVLSTDTVNGSSGTLTLPAGSYVSTAAGAYGVGGSGSTPTLDMSLYTLISGVVAASFVVIGHDNYSGGSAGSYPTTATTQAADVAAVTAKAAYIQKPQTILGVSGTFPSDAEIAAAVWSDTYSPNRRVTA